MLTVMIVGLAMGSTVVIGKAVEPGKAGNCISDRKYGNFIYGSGSGFYCAASGIR